MTTADAAEILTELISQLFHADLGSSPSRPNASTLSKPRTTGCERRCRTGRVSCRLPAQCSSAMARLIHVWSPMSTSTSRA
jgi:hypothetical protein